jgi:hypothetical protein
LLSDHEGVLLAQWAAGQGAQWPDVALEAVRFAENSPWIFVTVAGFLIILTVLALFLVWLMIPRAAYQMERMYNTVRNRAKREVSNDKHPD